MHMKFLMNVYNSGRMYVVIPVLKTHNVISMTIKSDDYLLCTWPDDKPPQADDGRAWEKVLELLVDHKINLNIQEVKMEVAPTGEGNESIQEKLVRPRFKKR